LEAMAAGRPVVASDAGGLGEIVTSEETGLCVPCGDERALAGAMERLLGDPGFAASLAASGRERALREYSWQRAADRTRQCYSRVLRRDTMA